MTETSKINDSTDQVVAAVRDPSVVQAGDLSEKLKACRERAQMSIEQAASEMKLSPVLLRALEEERFSDLPDPPYVRGYLRSYARLDESDPQDLVRIYEILRGSNPETLVTPNTAHLTRAASTREPRSRISPTTLRMFGLAGLVLVLGLLSMIPGVAHWAKTTWENFSEQTEKNRTQPTVVANSPLPADRNATSTRDTSGNSTTQTIATPTLAPSPATTTTTGSETTTTTPITPPLATSLQDTPSSTIASDSTSLNLASTTTTTPSTPATSASTVTAATTTTSTAANNSASTTATTNSTTTEPSASATANSPSNAATTETATSTPANTETATASTANDASATGNNSPETTTDTPAATDKKSAEEQKTPPRQPINGPVVVRMEFLKDVWVQVRDGNNKIIFEALNSANTWKEFKTRTPLKFKVGNAQVVRVYMNGQLFDQKPYTRGSVSRFTVN